jgi:hypothetical protein
MSATPLRSTRPIGHSMVIAGFLAITIVMTWPLARVWDPVLPDLPDSNFNVWRLSWTAHQLRSDPSHLFDANIFFPEANTLALSDAMVFVGVVAAPLIWAGIHPFTVHNLMVIAAFWMAAVGGYWLCLRLTNASWPAIAGGIVFGFTPYRFGHIAHLELLWTLFIPLGLLALMRLIETPTVRTGLQLAVYYVLQTMCSIYYGVYFAIYLAAAAVVMLIGRRDVMLRVVKAAAVAALAAIVCLLPYAARYREASGITPPRPIHEIRRFSATLSDYLRVSINNKVVTSGDSEGHEEKALYPGFAAAVLAVVGILTGTRWALVFAALLVIALDLSLGINGVLYNWLLTIVPLLIHLRAPARFGAFVMLTVAILAALGAHRLIQSRRVPRWIVPVLATAMLVEYWSAPIQTRRRAVHPPPLYAWLAAQPTGVVFEIPAPRADALWSYETEHQLMSIYHWKPLVNGYSGNAPRSYLRTLKRLEDFPSQAAIDHLHTLGVRWVIIHDVLTGEDTFPELVAATIRSDAFRFVGSYSDGFGHASVFELQASQAPHELSPLKESTGLRP